MPTLIPPTDSWPWPQVDIQRDKILALTQSLMDAGVQYGLGAKADPLSLQAGGFSAIDCSGFVRWAIFHATGQSLEIPDGSANQHEWAAEKGFKLSSYDGGLRHDGAIRIAFLTPFQGGGVGHVVLIVDGETCESHGHKGPDRRAWDRNLYPFMGEMSVFVLAAPAS